MPHPFNDPMFDKVDYVRGSIGAAAHAAFQLLLEEGGSHNDVVEMARQLQGAIGRAAKSALVMNAQSHIVPEPPEFNSNLGHKNQEQKPPEAPERPKNPFEDLP